MNGSIVGHFGEERTKLPFLLLGLACLFAMKLLYAIATLNDLTFLLAPVSMLVGLSQNAPSWFQADQGYIFPTLNIIVDASCAGGNFMILSFAVLGYVCWNELTPPKLSLYLLPVLLISSWLIAIVANVSRINVILMTRAFGDVHPWVVSDAFHELQGAFVYLTMLVLIFILTRYAIRKLKHTP